MNRAIFLIDAGEKLVEMREQAYDSEDLLQRLLATHPDLLAGDQIDASSPRRWMLVTREAAVPGELGGGGRWSVDHLFLDQDAVPTLVEVKRSSDSRIRREVVGQMLDYAANAVVYWPIEHLRAQFEARCQGLGTDPADELAACIGPETDAEAFWLLAKTNLQAGRVRMVFVADEIPPELRRIVEFLNQQMDPAEVLAVEIRQYAGEGMRTLVPVVMGQTAEAQQRKGTSSRGGPPWDEDRFFAHLASQRPAAEVAVARRILAWARERVTRVWWGRGTRSGAFVPVLQHAGTDHQLFSLSSTGGVEVYFYWHSYKAPFSDEGKRRELLARLNRIPGVALPPEAVFKRPSIGLDRLVEEEGMGRFLEAWEWFVGEVRGVG